MSTKVYGTSYDLIEIEGDISDEVGSFGTDEVKHGVLLMFSDGTILEVKYGKADLAVWGVAVLNVGTVFDRIETCMDADADPYSDVAYFRDGLRWGYAATEWERIR